jgi:hypothetical protein
MRLNADKIIWTENALQELERLFGEKIEIEIDDIEDSLGGLYFPWPITVKNVTAEQDQEGTIWCSLILEFDEVVGAGAYEVRMSLIPEENTVPSGDLITYVYMYDSDNSTLYDITTLAKDDDVSTYVVPNQGPAPAFDNFSNAVWIVMDPDRMAYELDNAPPSERITLKFQLGADTGLETGIPLRFFMYDGSGDIHDSSNWVVPDVFFLQDTFYAFEQAAWPYGPEIGDTEVSNGVYETSVFFYTLDIADFAPLLHEGKFWLGVALPYAVITVDWYWGVAT